MKLMDLSIKYEYPLLLVGKSGTGKTLYTKKFLNSISKKTYSKIDI
jgi:ABC-type dipeptide/oligopeptide/nickel transport system ATPase component